METDKMKIKNMAMQLVVTSVLALPVMAVEGVDLDKVFGELKQYDSGKSPIVLEQLRVQIRKSHTNAVLRSALEKRMIAVLESADATAGGKQVACKQLGRIGTRASVPALAKLLKDQKSAGDAVFALRTIPEPEAATALRNAAKDSPAQLDIIQALSCKEDVGSVPVIAELAKDKDEKLSAAAITALGFFPAEGAASALSELLKNKPGQAAVINHALLRSAQSLAAAGRTTAAVKMYRDLYGADLPLNIRRGAMCGIIQNDQKGGGELFLSVLRGKDPDLRQTAIGSGLRLLGDRADSVTPDVMALMPNLSTSEQAALLAVLVDHCGNAMTAHMLKLVASESSEQREMGLRGLAKVGDGTAVPALVRAAGNEGAEKKLALTALRQIQGEGIDQAIGDALEKAEAPLRIELIRTLRDRNAVSQVTRFLQCMTHADAEVSIAVSKALGDLAGKEHLQTLLKNLIGLDDEKTMSAAKKALSLTARRTGAEADLVPHVCAALTAARSDKLRVTLLRLLGGLPCERSFTALRAAMNDENAGIRDVAVRELCDWPGVEAMPVLEHVVGHSDNKVHRVLALRGCVRLLRTAGSTVSGDQAAQYVQATVKTAQQALADEVTRRDAALAIISMAPVIAGFNPAAARAALDEVSKHSKDADMTAKVQAFVQCIDGFGDYVMNWQVSPAYGGKPCTHLFHQVFDPEKKGAGVAWSLMPVGTNPQQPWLINIGAFHSEDPHQVTYLRTSIRSSVARKVRLEMGSDDGIKVWVNSKLAHANNALRGVTPGQDKAEATLNADANEILVKVTQNVGPWGMCLRAQSLAPIVKTVSEAETVAIFDGKTLDGWSGDLEYWSVKDGAIVGHSAENVPHNVLIWHKDKVKDFYLAVDVKQTPYAANAGIQFRSRKHGTHHAHGYQADVGQSVWGRLYHEAGHGKLVWTDTGEKAVKPLEWNHYEILAVGPNIWTAINGTLSLAYYDPKGEREGSIALQIHSGVPQTVRYRVGELIHNPAISIAGMDEKALMSVLKPKPPVRR